MTIYDDKDFFNAYSKMPRSNSLDAAGEWYMMRELLPDVGGYEVLDLGCGYGWHSRYICDKGARHIIALDVSFRMLEVAKKIHSDKRIDYLQCSIEGYSYPNDHFDLVFSNLALHYIEDLDHIYKEVHKTLKEGGYFIFNIEHPTFTSGIDESFIYDEKGNVLYYPIDDYFIEGQRDTLFLDHQIKKYHHTLETIIDHLLKVGFKLERLIEAKPGEEEKDAMPDELRRPMMLMVKARK